MIPRLLELLQVPRDSQELARELGATVSAVEGMLRLLEGRGYVGYAYDESPACGTGCGGCSVRRLCPAEGEEAPFLKVWRVTSKGRQYAIAR